MSALSRPYQSRKLRASCKAERDMYDVQLIRCPLGGGGGGGVAPMRRAARSNCRGLGASLDDTRRRTTRQTNAGGTSSTEQEQAGPIGQHYCTISRKCSLFSQFEI